jgi:hypothetical protein
MRSRMSPQVSGRVKTLAQSGKSADKSVRPTRATYPVTLEALLIKCRGLHPRLRVPGRFLA